MITYKELKKRIIEISYKHKLSHLGSNLTAVGIIDEIFSEMNEEDKFVLSSGHAGLALYVVLEKYYGTNAEDTFNHHGVHPDRCSKCRIDVSSGSLGHGIGIAVGYALANPKINVYCLMSDGECSEGSVHEALRIKFEQKVDNLKVYVNYNFWGAYKHIDDLHLAPSGLEKIKIVRGTMAHLAPFPFLKNQDAHYYTMTEEDYKLAMENLK